jgi:hypothetical protein
MTSDDYRHYVRFSAGRSAQLPEELWRERGGEWEYLSLVDWQWHRHLGKALLPHPNTLVEVSAQQAAELQRDRQRFVRYFARYDKPAPGPDDEPLLVYRYRRLPTTGEVFGDENSWERTRTVSHFLNPGPNEPPFLVEIDQATAEAIIQRSRGVSGATEL